MIRLMSLIDVTAVCEMLIDLRDESPEYAFVDDDWDYVPRQLKSMICDPNTVAVIDEDYKGFMIGHVGSQWYSKRIDAHEQLLLVGSAHRGSMVGIRLIKAFEQEARNMGAVNILAGASIGVNDERTIQLYERMGYTRLGTGVRKRL